MALDQALTTGAMALFGEKYGEEVRVVSVPGFSRELCGGTHVRRTGDIGICKIVYEGSISAGVRRIEAITGETALRQYQESTDALRRVAEMFRASEPELIEHVEKTARHRTRPRKTGRAAEEQAGAVRRRRSSNRSARTVKDVARRRRPPRRHGPRSRCAPWPIPCATSGRPRVVVLASAEDGAVSIVSAVTKDLTGKVHAGKLVGAVAQAVGGKGGGRPDMAEGGGKDPSALDAAPSKTSTAMSRAKL